MVAGKELGLAYTLLLGDPVNWERIHAVCTVSWPHAGTYG